VNYRIDGLETFDAWLESEPSEPIRAAVTDWLFRLVEDPHDVDATPVPIGLMGLPVWTAIVPDTNVAVTWSVMKHPPYPEPVVVLREVGPPRGS
jgi:hypothetical protein